MDKVLLSSSLPKPSSIKEEEVGDFSDISVEDTDAEATSNSDVFLAQSSPKGAIVKNAPSFFSLPSKTVETSVCSSPVSSLAFLPPSFSVHLTGIWVLHVTPLPRFHLVVFSSDLYIPNASCLMSFCVVSPRQDSPTILEEPESPLGFTSSEKSSPTSKPVTPKSEPIPITISTCKDRKSNAPRRRPCRAPPTPCP